MTSMLDGSLSRGLIGYAVLRANFNYQAPSYVDNFSPYVLDSLCRTHPVAADEATVAEAVRENFGFTIPDRVVGTLLRRAVKRGKVLAVDGEYVLAGDAVQTLPDISAEAAQFGRQQQEVVAKFLDFVSGFAPDHLHLIQQDPEKHLTHFVEKHAAPLLSHALRGKRRSLDADDVTGPDFLVNAFISHLGEKDSVAFGYIVDLVKGAILAAVVELGTGQLKRRLHDLNFVLDTPILLKALGFQGAAQQRAVIQTIQLAKEHSAQVVCFPHTIKEVDGVLDSVVPVLRSRGARSGALREVDAHFLDKGSTAADIEIERGNLRTSIQRLGIREVPTPDTHYQYGLDEAALDDLLEKVVHYRSATTRRYDVETLSAVHRLRKGSSPAEFERCRWVLVTDNGKVVRAARKVDERHEWPLAMADADMAALLWVRSPAVSEDLPRNQLLATVYSGMQPGGHLWAKYLDEIERLQVSGRVNDDDALLLRARPEARAALMTVTLGADSVDEESIAAVLARVRDDLERPLKTELVGAELARETALNLAAEAQEQRRVEAASREQFEQQVSTLKQQVDALHEERKAQTASVSERAQRRARRMVGAVVYTVGALLVLGGAVHFVAPDWVRGSGRLATACLIAAAIVAALGLWRHIAGGSARDWSKKVEAPLARSLERRYRRAAGLAD